MKIMISKSIQTAIVLMLAAPVLTGCGGKPTQETKTSTFVPAGYDKTFGRGGGGAQNGYAAAMQQGDPSVPEEAKAHIRAQLKMHGGSP